MIHYDQVIGSGTLISSYETHSYTLPKNISKRSGGDLLVVQKENKCGSLFYI